MTRSAERAASYVRTDPEGELPPREHQLATIGAYAGEMGYKLVAGYEDLEAPGILLYRKPALKEAIDNIKEDEEWDVLLLADPRCVSDSETALHELVHKFSLYGNRLECPGQSWDELREAMSTYRREMARRGNEPESRAEGSA